MLLLGERLTAEEAVRCGLANKVVPADEFDDAVADWAAKLAVEEPGADAARPRRDVPAAGHGARRRARVPALAALARPSRPRTSSRACRRSSRSASRNGRADSDGDQGHEADGRAGGRGAQGRRRRQGSRGARGAGRGRGRRADRDEGPGRGPSRAPRAGEARRRRGEDRPPARARQADRARADRPAGRPGHLRRDRHPRRPPLLAALDGGQGGAGRRRDHRLGRRRRPPLLHRRLRLHGDGRLDGDDRRAQGGPPARDGAAEADAVDLAARLGRSADPGGGRLAVRRLGPPVPRGGDDVRRRAAGRGDARPLRGGHRLHPRASPTSCRWSSARARWRSPART